MSQANIDQLQKLIDNPHISDSHKELAAKKIEKLKAEIDKPSESPVKSEQKNEPKKKVHKKKETKSKPKKKVGRKSKNIVQLDGVDYDSDSPEFCQALVERHKRRSADAKKNAYRAKTIPVFEQITDKLSGAAIKAIRSHASENKDEIKKNPGKFIAKIKGLQSATKEYLQKFRGILGDEYDPSEIKEMEQNLEAYIKKIEQKM